MHDSYLFDLDGTLIDTSGIEDARTRRAWKECVSGVAQTSVFPGVRELLAAIRSNGKKIAIVTTSVSYYAQAMLKFHKVPYDVLVAYHDVRNTKPAPDCYQRALELLKTTADHAVGIGDDIVDANALRSAGIRSIAAAWNAKFHQHATWDHVANEAYEVLSF